LLAYVVIIVDDHHFSPLLCLFPHKLFEEKNLTTSIIIALAELFLYSKSRKDQSDAYMMLIWCYPSRAGKMGSKHWKSSNLELV